MTVRLKRVLQQALAACCLPMMLASIAGGSLAQTLSLEELDRFPLRLPLVMTYDAHQCRLWIAGSPQVRHVTLRGEGVTVYDTSRVGVSLLTYRDERLLVVAAGRGSDFVLGADGLLRTRGIRFRIGSLDRVMGGDILNDGRWLVAVEHESALRLLSADGREIGHVPTQGTVRGVAQDDASGLIFVATMTLQGAVLEVFSPQLTPLAVATLPSDLGQVEAVAVQPETGDIFVSFLEPATINGTVIRYMVDLSPVGGLVADVERPAYACAIA